MERDRVRWTFDTVLEAHTSILADFPFVFSPENCLVKMAFHNNNPYQVVIEFGIEGILLNPSRVRSSK